MCLRGRRSGPERYSLVLADGPYRESLVDPEMACGRDEAPGDPPINRGEAIQARMDSPFRYRQKGRGLKCTTGRVRNGTAPWWNWLRGQDSNLRQGG